MVLNVSPETSLSREVVPILRQELKDVGFSLLKLNIGKEDISNDFIALCTVLGAELGTAGLSFATIEGDSSSEKLSAHVEGIFSPSGVFPYFALACLATSSDGGQTRIIDGRAAADLVSAVPELENVRIEYSSLAYPGATKTYRLVEDFNGGVLRYRQRVSTNRVLDDRGFPEAEIYRMVDEIVERCVVCVHSWSVGDLMFVNNRITLHDRLPFFGIRKMLRVRYNDSENYRFRY